MSDEQKTAMELAREAAELKAAETNASRTGVGTRVKVGATRGKNPQVISFEQWDDGQPDTLPKTLQAFMDIRNVTSEADMLDRVIRGDNDVLYELASDPIAEYVNPAWPDKTADGTDITAAFRLAVRQYSRGAMVSIEDAAGVIRPAFDKAHMSK